MLMLELPTRQIGSAPAIASEDDPEIGPSEGVCAGRLGRRLEPAPAPSLRLNEVAPSHRSARETAVNFYSGMRNALSLKQQDHSFLLNLTLAATHLLDAARESTVLTDFDQPKASKFMLPLLATALVIGHANTLFLALKAKKVINAPEQSPGNAEAAHHSRSGRAASSADSARRLEAATNILSAISRLISYYANPAKQVAKDSALATIALGANYRKTRPLRHLAPLALALINFASMSRLRYTGSASDLIGRHRPLRGEHTGHILRAPQGNVLSEHPALFREIPHNAGASLAYAKHLFTDPVAAILANQRDSLTHQLERGARALMLDAKLDPEKGIRSSHEVLDYGPFVNPLKEIGTFLRRPDQLSERVILLIENVNSIGVEDFADVFRQANIFDLLPTDRQAWEPSHLDDPAFSNARIFPIIGRTWQGSLNATEPGFARSVTITGNDTDSYNYAQTLTAPTLGEPLVVVAQTNWNKTLPDLHECPLSCEPITNLACIEVINHFSPIMAPEVFTELSSAVERHAEQCTSPKREQNLFVAIDHTQNV